MIYDLITSKVSDILKNHYFFTERQILYEDEIPESSVKLFARLYWDFGEMKKFDSLVDTSSDTFYIDLFEKKTSQYHDIESLMIPLRKEMSNKLSLVKDVLEIGVVDSISTIKNENDRNWSGFSIQIKFNIFNERGV